MNIIYANDFFSVTSSKVICLWNVQWNLFNSPVPAIRFGQDTYSTICQCWVRIQFVMLKLKHFVNEHTFVKDYSA